MKTYFLVILLSFSAGLGASSSSSQDNDNNKVAERFRTALDIVHCHIAALRRTRTGNPTHNQAALIKDYETLSSIIQSIPYYMPTPHPLAQLHTYRPKVTAYKKKTTLNQSQKYAFNQITMGINLIRNKHGAIQPLFGNLLRTINLAKSDLKNHNVDSGLRTRVITHKNTAQEHIKALATPKKLRVDNYFEPISKQAALKQQNLFFNTKTENRKRKGPMDQYIKKINNNETGSKKQKTFHNTVPKEAIISDFKVPSNNQPEVEMHN